MSGPPSGLTGAGRPSPADPSRPAHAILIVENNPPLRDALVDLLASWGYEALAASSGAEALAICEAQGALPDTVADLPAMPSIGAPAISLILTDWILPDATGRQLAERLQARGIGCKILVLTGHAALGSPTQQSDGQASGDPCESDGETTAAGDSSLPANIVGWLTKPPDTDQLATAISDALG